MRFGEGFGSAVQSMVVYRVDSLQVRPLIVEIRPDSMPRAKRITVIGTQIFRGTSWGEILGEPSFRCLTPEFFTEKRGRSPFYPVLKPLRTAQKKKLKTA